MAALSGTVAYVPTTHEAGVTEHGAKVALTKEGFCPHGVQMQKKKKNSLGISTGLMIPSGNTCQQCDFDLKERELAFEQKRAQVCFIRTPMQWKHQM